MIMPMPIIISTSHSSTPMPTDPGSWIFYIVSGILAFFLMRFFRKKNDMWGGDTIALSLGLIIAGPMYLFVGFCFAIGALFTKKNNE